MNIKERRNASHGGIAKIMEMSYISKLVGILDEKILLLEKYDEITDRMSGSELDALAELIAERQLIIPKVDRKSAEIQEIVSNQLESVQTVLKEILSFKKINCNAIYNDLQNKAEALEKTLISISYKEKSVVTRFDTLKKNLEEEMLKSNKSRQVIDYCNAFTVVDFNGNSFNSVT